MLFIITKNQKLITFSSKKEGLSKTLLNITLCAFINKNGKITTRNIREIFELSNEGALKEIKKLINLEIIKSEGKGKALYYILN